MTKSKMFASSLVVFCLILLLIIPIQVEVKCAEQVFLEDDFESYSLGVFPSKHWQLRFNGEGLESQVIKNDPNVSQGKILQLVSKLNLASRANVALDSKIQIIGFEVKVKLELDGTNTQAARVGFSEYGTTTASGTYANWHAHVCIFDDGIIHAANGSPIGTYVSGTWCKIRVILDKELNEYAVWINEELKIENKVFPDDPYKYNYFSLGATWHNPKIVYFDDVKIFSNYEANPHIDLQPTQGTSQTTIQGSGFAPNSDITVTWNKTKMLTVPYDVQTDNHGNFSTIISVLNQTQNGKYQIVVNDNTKNTASAQFTVIPEFASWTILPIFLISTLSLVFYKKKICKQPLE